MLLQFTNIRLHNFKSHKFTFKMLTAMLAVAVAFLGLLAAASPTPNSFVLAKQCKTGTAQCCTNVGSAQDPAIISTADVSSSLLNGITGILGTGCTS
jgi:hypothetical protein